MATFEEAKAASAASERMALELKHLLTLLEAEPLWQGRGRHSLPEPARTNLLTLEANVESLRESTDKHLLAREMFKEGVARLGPQLAMGMLPTAEIEESWALSVQGMEMMAQARTPSVEFLRGTINMLRTARNEAPLDGSENTLN